MCFNTLDNINSTVSVARFVKNQHGSGSMCTSSSRDDDTLVTLVHEIGLMSDSDETTEDVLDFDQQRWTFGETAGRGPARLYAAYSVVIGPMVMAPCWSHTLGSTVVAVTKGCEVTCGLLREIMFFRGGSDARFYVGGGKAAFGLLRWIMFFSGGCDARFYVGGGEAACGLLRGIMFFNGICSSVRVTKRCEVDTNGSSLARVTNDTNRVLVTNGGSGARVTKRAKADTNGYSIAKTDMNVVEVTNECSGARVTKQCKADTNGGSLARVTNAMNDVAVTNGGSGAKVTKRTKADTNGSSIVKADTNTTNMSTNTNTYSGARAMNAITNERSLARVVKFTNEVIMIMSDGTIMVESIESMKWNQSERQVMTKYRLWGCVNLFNLYLGHQGSYQGIGPVHILCSQWISYEVALNEEHWEDQVTSEGRIPSEGPDGEQANELMSTSDEGRLDGDVSPRSLLVPTTVLAPTSTHVPDLVLVIGHLWSCLYHDDYNGPYGWRVRGSNEPPKERYYEIEIRDRDRDI